MYDKPFSQSCENNKEPILQALKVVFTEPASILEIGSGSGQHAVYFCHRLPHLQWQPSERQENIEGIKAWRNWALTHWSLKNLAPPLVLDVNDEKWPLDKTNNQVDGVFTANTCHIMDWDSVQAFVRKAAACLKDDGQLCIYGPFNYPDSDEHIRYTSASNAHFDRWLKQRDSRSGIRNLPAMAKLAQRSGLGRLQDLSMPANNRLLIWQKISTSNLGLEVE